MLHKPLSCSPFRIVHCHCWSCGRIALCSSALALALNLLTSMVCHWCVLAMWWHSTLANSRTNWDKVGLVQLQTLQTSICSKQQDLEGSHFATFQSRQSGIPIFHEPQCVRSQISWNCYHHISRYSYSWGFRHQGKHMGTNMLSKLSQSQFAYLQ